ncbi:MAG: glycosyl hydrolase 53 family protein [Candidatus Helarchaeota archaeon]
MKKKSFVILIFLLLFPLFSSVAGSKLINNVNNTMNLLSTQKYEPESDKKCKNRATEGSPSLPQILSPLNESTSTSHILKFDWTDVGTPSDGIFYEFMMDNDTDFNSPEAARFAINTWSNSTMAEEPYTIFLAHFDDNSTTEDGEDPTFEFGTSLTTGKFGQGIKINQSSTGILAYNTTNNLNNNAGTIEFWIRLEQNSSDITSWPWVFDFNISTIDNSRLSLIYSPTSKFFYVDSKVNGTDYLLFPAREISWNADEWHHICFTWGDIARLYFDGIEEAVATYFPIANGPGDEFYLGTYSGGGAWINATFDELRISSIQRIPFWKEENTEAEAYYFGYPNNITRTDIWHLNRSEYTHMFEQDGNYYWKIRSHNQTGSGNWSTIRVVTVNRLLNPGIPLQITILDNNSDLVIGANVSFEQTEVVNQLMGVDANYYIELNKIYGENWKHEGNPINLYEFFGNNSCNSFRTRLWMKNGSANSLENATLMAKWAQKNGSRPYLVIFLSDNWADINRQPLPEAFQGLTFEERLANIKNYSRNVTTHFKNESIDMEFYEIGNEIDYGICGVYANLTDPRNNLTWLRKNIWYNSARIINASIEGIREVDPDAQFLLHIAISDPAFAISFFKAMDDFGVPYNMMGLSYYPNTNGNASQNGFRETFRVLSTSGLPGSDKIIIPESAYVSNYNGSIVFTTWNKSVEGYPLTPQGQKNWLMDNLEWCYQHPNLAGYIYFSPELYNEIWGGFSWFNSTGDSKPVVEAYPEFFNLRNSSLSSWVYSNGQGLATINAYRGNLTITVKIGNYTEEFNITISPFRSTVFILNLSIDVPPAEDNLLLLIFAGISASSNDQILPGIPNFLLFSSLAVVGIVVTSIIIVKVRKKPKILYFPDKK